MDNQPLISVIVPCYNQAQYLDECLQSVLHQTYQNWECIIVNDGSPDNTEEIAQKWIEEDSRFRYLKKENGGLSSARNAGIEASTGQWIQFLDCDDKIASSKFEKAQPYFDHNDVIISNYQLFDDTGYQEDYCNFMGEKLSYENLVLRWDVNFSIPIHCAIFRKSLIKKKFNESLKAKEDWFFWLDYFIQEPSYIITDERLAYYRLSQKTMTQNIELMLENEERAYSIIYDRLDDQLKKSFFTTRIHYKNSAIKSLEILERTNLNLNTKLASKRYKTLDSFLRKFGL